MTKTNMDWVDVITSIHGAMWDREVCPLEASVWFMSTHIRVTARGIYLEDNMDNYEGFIKTVWKHFIGLDELTELFDYSKWLDGVLDEDWKDQAEDRVFEVWKYSSMTNEDWVTVLKAIQGPLWKVNSQDGDASYWFMGTHLRVTDWGIYLEHVMDNYDGFLETVWEHFIGIDELEKLFDYSEWFNAIVEKTWLDQAEDAISEVWYKIPVK